MNNALSSFLLHFRIDDLQNYIYYRRAVGKFLSRFRHSTDRISLFRLTLGEKTREKICRLNRPDIFYRTRSQRVVFSGAPPLLLSRINPRGVNAPRRQKKKKSRSSSRPLWICVNFSSLSFPRARQKRRIPPTIQGKYTICRVENGIPSNICAAYFPPRGKTLRARGARFLARARRRRRRSRMRTRCYMERRSYGGHFFSVCATLFFYVLSRMHPVGFALSRNTSFNHNNSFLVMFFV